MDWQSGPDGRLYIADLGNSRVVSYNLVTGETAVPITGLKNPWGIAVDSSNNLYVADTGNGNVLIDAAGAQSTLTVPNAAAPWGVRVDASGSLIVSDHATGNIVWVPSVAGVLTPASAVTIEKNPDTALGIALDASGNLFTTDATGASVYAIQRTAAALNLGTVSDGVTNSANVTLESDGNMPATLATPDVTEPTNTMFTLVPAASNGCSSGSSGPPGMACQFTGTFAPPPATRQRTAGRHGNHQCHHSGCHVQREPQRHSHCFVDSAADHHRLQPAHDAAGRPGDHAVGNRRRIRQSGRLLDRRLFGMSNMRHHHGQHADGSFSGRRQG